MNTISLIIDDISVTTEKGKSVLEAALEANVYIPHLCYHPDLMPAGSCRLCVVEVDNSENVVTSCNLQATEGMVIKTKTVQLEQMRRTALDLIMASHPEDCTGCPKYGKCELQSLTQYIGVNNAKYRRRSKGFAANEKNPLFLHDINRCILCGRCVRACQDMRGVKVLDYNKKGAETYIGTPLDIPLGEAGCKFCGACVEVCPTGTIRDKEGILNTDIPYRNALVPCRSTCPAQIDIPRYIRFIKEKNYPMATAVVREKVPFPTVLGNVCNHKCETVCRRSEVNEPISICRLKRFASENDNGIWKTNSKQLPLTGKKIGVVGAGPAGLTAGYYLAKNGHNVTIFEALEKAGGMCQVGIPEYRLPREIVASEIKEILNQGVKIKTNTKIESPQNLLKQGFDAVLMAIGTHQGVRLPIKGSDLPEVIINTDFLRDVSLGNKEPIEGKVVVLGGGNVAFDCARSALRLGAKEVHLACLEQRENMTASQEELTEALDEGIFVHNGRTFEEITSNEGKVTGVKCQKVKSFSFDENKRLVIQTEEHSEHIFEADTVIFAVGQRPEITEKFGLTLGRGNTIIVDQKDMLTNVEGVFAAGDVTTGTNSVIAAIASGRNASQAIDEYLGGDGNIEEKLAVETEVNPWIGREEGFALLERQSPRLADSTERAQSFNAMDFGYDEEKAITEANRCLQCDLRTCIISPKFWNEYDQKGKQKGEDL